MCREIGPSLSHCSKAGRDSAGNSWGEGALGEHVAAIGARSRGLDIIMFMISVLFVSLFHIRSCDRHGPPLLAQMDVGGDFGKEEYGKATSRGIVSLLIFLQDCDDAAHLIRKRSLQSFIRQCPKKRI